MTPELPDSPSTEPNLREIELAQARTSIATQLDQRVAVDQATILGRSPSDLLRDREAIVALLILATFLAVATGALLGMLVNPLTGLLVGILTFPASVSTLALTPASRRLRDRTRYSVPSLASWGRDGAYLAGEAHIVLLAARMSETIVNHPVWQSEWLDYQRVRMNPTEELGQIADRAMRLRQLRSDLGARPPESSPTGSVSAIYDRQVVALDLVETALLDRAAAMYVYVNQLDRLTPLLEAMNSVKRIHSVADRINELVGQSVSDALAVHDVTTLRHELDDIAGSIQAVLRWLGTPPAQLPLR